MKARGKSSSDLCAVGSIRSLGTPIGQETPAPLRAFPPPSPASRGWSQRSEPSLFSLPTQTPNPLSSAPTITLTPDALPGSRRNSLDRGEQAAVWSGGSSVILPQEPGRGSEMSSIPIASPSALGDCPRRQGPFCFPDGRSTLIDGGPGPAGSRRAA